MIQSSQFIAAWLQNKFGVDLFRDAEEGQGLVEYALILVLVAVAAVVILGSLSTAITAEFQKVITAL